MISIESYITYCIICDKNLPQNIKIMDRDYWLVCSNKCLNESNESYILEEDKINDE